MTIREITFQEFKDSPQQRWCRAAAKDSTTLILEDDSEGEYLLENVNVESVGSHIAVTVDGERIFIEKYRQRTVWEESRTILLLLLVLFSALYASEYLKSNNLEKSSADKDVRLRIKELQEIQTSISKMSAYVENQKNTLAETSKLLDSVKKEKENVETALKINREQLDALLFRINKDAERDKWIERIVSFITGIISSLIASKIWQARQRVHQQHPNEG